MTRINRSINYMYTIYRIQKKVLGRVTKTEKSDNKKNQVSVVKTNYAYICIFETPTNYTYTYLH